MVAVLCFLLTPIVFLLCMELAMTPRLRHRLFHARRLSIGCSLCLRRHNTIPLPAKK